MIHVWFSFMPKGQGMHKTRNDLEEFDIHESSLDIFNCMHDLADKFRPCS